jgi:hypothetical protein
MKIINVNICRHGSDQNKVYISVTVDGSEYVINGDHVSVNISRDLPDVTNCHESKVSVYHDYKRLGYAPEEEHDGADEGL